MESYTIYVGSMHGCSENHYSFIACQHSYYFFTPENDVETIIFLYNAGLKKMISSVNFEFLGF